MSGGARQALKVFVGNLPWTVGTNELRHFGSNFGIVSHATVVFDKNTGLSKGYGFMTFENKEAASTALKTGTGTHHLEGNQVVIQAANQLSSNSNFNNKNDN